MPKRRSAKEPAGSTREAILAAAELNSGVPEPRQAAGPPAAGPEERRRHG
jgi:hypothetical protein